MFVNYVSNKSNSSMNLYHSGSSTTAQMCCEELNTIPESPKKQKVKVSWENFCSLVAELGQELFLLILPGIIHKPEGDGQSHIPLSQSSL